MMEQSLSLQVMVRAAIYVIWRTAIDREESCLTDQLGDAYREYGGRVRHWIHGAPCAGAPGAALVRRACETIVRARTRGRCSMFAGHGPQIPPLVIVPAAPVPIV